MKKNFMALLVVFESRMQSFWFVLADHYVVWLLAQYNYATLLKYRRILSFGNSETRSVIAMLT